MIFYPQSNEVGAGILSSWMSSRPPSRPSVRILVSRAGLGNPRRGRGYYVALTHPPRYVDVPLVVMIVDLLFDLHLSAKIA